MNADFLKGQLKRVIDSIYSPKLFGKFSERDQNAARTYTRLFSYRVDQRTEGQNYFGSYSYFTNHNIIYLDL